METTQEIREKRSWEEYISLGMEARSHKDTSCWTLGDLASSIEKDYGKDSIGKYAYAIGVDKKTLMNYRTIALRFDRGTRETYQKLSYSHFACLTSIEKPEAWLEEADTKDWSVETLRRELRHAYLGLKEPKLEEKPKVYRCPNCGLWRLKDVSALNICKGHYTMRNGKQYYE